MYGHNWYERTERKVVPMGRLGSFMAKMALTIALTGSAALLLADCGGSASAPSSTQSTPSSDAVSASSGSATTRTRAASASSNPTSGAQSAITASGGGPPCWFTARRLLNKQHSPSSQAQ